MDAPARPVTGPDPQLSFGELGTPLSAVTFVVVDLETTGGPPDSDAITEIGAVKVRGGEVVGEFATLVDPGVSVPPAIIQLTGITTAMVTGAPRLREVLGAFLEFCAGAVLVAHNAPFDIGHLRAACRRHGPSWPRPAVVCTARLGRRVLTRDEAPSCRLSALATLFGARTRPIHRALDDAKATVDVLHGLLERVGGRGVSTLEDLLALQVEVSPAQRAKRHLADAVPEQPGVYLFRGPGDEVLYVGTSGDLRRRVRSYFTGGDKRARIKEMIGLVERVDWVVCAHALEAEVRELRLLAGHAPRYNRRSRFPHRGWWVALTDEPFPRLSVVRTPRADAIGPFTRRPNAVDAVAALQDAVRLRPCTQRIPARGASGTPCALHEMGRCAAPCAGHLDVEAYRPVVDDARALVRGNDDAGLRRLSATVTELAAAERFEDAAAHRDRLAELAHALGRVQRLSAVAAAPEMIAARPDGERGWDLAVVRHGRLAAAGRARRGVPPMPVVESLVASAETVRPAVGPLCGAPPEEVAVVTRWLERPGTRMVRTTTPWAMPAAGAGAWGAWVGRAREARHTDPERAGTSREPP
ncbi:DNA polymerase III subunit epsilon [Actinomycetospora sp. NBRC 106375]|uniref:DEDD exonuclease domain-containing protein n=1 Tax=Actinomycetospora sp. NBRC 106375 TaxID=3032207 RepID=UPI0024A22693|nr:DEDD exonuclease domain-containing protein [Actinomycetospora sp. NBRC 106375]GLZ47412.1 DNA polymerase III subunit epsilon [Actinomycetospora sp. NBRC 106375]